MEMIKVESSHIKSVGWDNNTLFVEYNTGTYKYADVPQKTFNELLGAESKGKFMHLHIKNRYNYKKLF